MVKSITIIALFSIILLSASVAAFLPGVLNAYGGGPSTNLTINKETIGGTGTFDFDNSTDDVADFSIYTGSFNPNSQTFVYLSPTTVNIKELVEPNWELTDIVCLSSGTTTVYDDISQRNITATFSGHPSDWVNCTFYNTKNSTLTITKEFVPEQFDEFGSIPPANFTGDNGLGLFNLGDGQSQQFSIFNNTIYNITENAIGDDISALGVFDTEISCGELTNDTGFATDAHSVELQLVPGEEIECVFTNTIKNMTLTIIKETDPVGDETEFSFEGNFTNTPFTLTGLFPGNTTSFSLYPFTWYDLTEVVPLGWELNNIDCTGTPFGYVANEDDLMVNFTAFPTANVTCTFENTINNATLTIIKETEPSASDIEFDFTTNSTDYSSFSLTGNQAGTPTNSTVLNLYPGAYNITETVPSQWELTNIDCGVVDIANNRTTVTLAPDENLICTFENLLPADVAVTKNATAYVYGGDDIEYFINVTNYGPADATGVVVTDTIDPLTSYLVNGTFGDPFGPWNIGLLSAGSSVDTSVTVTAGSDVGYNTNIVNVTSTSIESNYVNNNATASTLVLPLSLVTNGGDVDGFDVNATSTDTDEFRLIYTPDPLNLTGNFTLRSSNPGNFFYHAFIIGNPGDPVNMNVTIPGPFVTKGSNPIQAYSDVSIDSNNEFVPANPISFTSSPSIVSGLAGAEINITGEIPNTGLFYVKIHLDYGLKKQFGYVKTINDNANNVNDLYDVLNHTPYPFALDVDNDDTDEDTQTIYNENVFKNPRGVLVFSTDLPDAIGETVSLKYSNGNTIQGVPNGSIDDEGYYFFDYQNKGKTTNYKIVSECTENPSTFSMGKNTKYVLVELTNCT